MFRHILGKLFPLLLFVFGFTPGSDAVDEREHLAVRDTVDMVILPIMREQSIPGMAVAVTVDGKSDFFNYGVASRETRQPVTSETLFEIGSISKTLTATLATYAQINGQLSLTDNVSKYLPLLRCSSFDKISLLNLGTHTSGGLPLQVPENIRTNDELIDYLKHWIPSYAPGTYRTYSNVSIGLLGMITAESMHQSFEDAMEKTLLPALGLTRSYINVPTDQMSLYAQGYIHDDKPVRVSPGVLSSEAYGIKSNSSDMIRFLFDNMRPVPPEAEGIDGKVQRAVNDTHIGYFTAGELIQDLIWEHYPYPGELKRVLFGNSAVMIMQPVMATQLTEPLPPQSNALINKTGSTNGFAAYVAFVPAKRMGIVILANKSYPIAARVIAAHKILMQLDHQP